MRILWKSLGGFAFLLALGWGVLVFTGHSYVISAITHNIAFLHDHQIFDQRTVENDEPQRLPKSSSFGNLKLSDTLENKLRDNRTIAYLVLKNDSLIYEDYWLSGRKDTISNSFSVTKTIVSLLVGKALEEGHITSLDDPAGKYYSSFQEKGRDAITIRDLLTMSSGLDWEELYGTWFAKTTKSYHGKDLPSVINGLEMAEDPGETFNYRSCDTQVLGFVLEKATGKTISELASEHLWQPLGTRRNASWSLDRQGGHEKAYCCFNATARDLAKVGLMMNNDGVYQGDTLIDPDYIRAMRKPANLKTSTGNEVDFFGKSLWLLPEIRGYEAFYARGLHGQYIISIPEKELLIVRLGHLQSDSDGAHPLDAMLMVEEAIEWAENGYI